jgi:hypothetical protein
MKRHIVSYALFFLVLLLALVLSSIRSEGERQINGIPTAWKLPELLSYTSEPSQTPGWWQALPTAISLATSLLGTGQ